MANAILILSGSIILVFIGAVIFVNAIEYVGHRFHLGGSFVGAILAPLLTSFPELIVFLVAVFGTGGEAGEDIGIGTIFGQPFMASSLSYGLVGIAVLTGFLMKKRKSTTLIVDKTLMIPYVFITVLFPLTLIPGFWNSMMSRYLFAVLFLASFLLYGYLMYQRKTAGLIQKAAIPYFAKILPKSKRSEIVAGIIQLLVTVGLIYIGSKWMVNSVEFLATGSGISPLGLAIIIVPAATAIPETASALIWGSQGKDTLAIGALVGEKILYSTFYPAMGLFLTSWVIDAHAVSSVVATFIISLILLYYIARQRMPWYGLCFGFIFFVAYAIMIFLFRF